MEDRIAARAGRANGPFGELVVGALERLGVGHFVVSPGSRSTPLALAAAGLGAGRHSVCLDERSAAFQALGRVKATRRPVALVCTSGTAGAHYFPALIEAREACLPLVVLTADRPPELRHCHAGQTIDQHKLFGAYPVFHAELPLPEPDPLLARQVREICRRAVEAALGLPPGPVHLNCPFREPFFPAEAPAGEFTLASDLLAGLAPVEPAAAACPDLGALPERTLILAGPRPWLDPEEEPAALLALGAARGWPILADGANPLRTRSGGECVVVAHYDRLARDDAAWAQLAPEALLLWGEPPTSKALRQRLAQADLPGYQLGGGKPGMNPFHGKIATVPCTAVAFAQRCRGTRGKHAEQWAAADRAAGAALEAALARPHPLFEGDVHRLLGAALPAGAAVLYANSLAIRDAEWFLPARPAPLRPFSQRGANGIDGTLSLARGIAAGLGAPVYLVAGDLALLHDCNGLLGAAAQDPGVFVVLLNNAGGGIFEFLPVASRTDCFEHLFAAPQAADFSLLARAHGASHQLCDSLPRLEQALAGWDGRGVRLAEVPVDRKASRDLHPAVLKP